MLELTRPTVDQICLDPQDKLLPNPPPHPSDTLSTKDPPPQDKKVSACPPKENFWNSPKQTDQVVASQLTEHLSNFDPAEPLHLAYMAKHSCDTAVRHVQNDILPSVDEGKIGILLLLDVLSAFNTVDHGALLDSLQEEPGIGGTVLDWFTSYLANRCQVVIICGEKSKSCQPGYGVLQGSVLGPQLFTVYNHGAW